MNHVTPELEKWMRYGERGASSETMAEVFAGFPHGFLANGSARAHPEDPADFRRCVLFLEAVPEMRPRLGEMKLVSPEWAVLVEHWDELEEIYHAEAPKGHCPELYCRMSLLIIEAQKKIVLGEISNEGFDWFLYYGPYPYIRVGEVVIMGPASPANIRKAFEMAKKQRHNP